MTLRAQTLWMLTGLLVAAVLATAGVLAWSTRQAIEAEATAQALVIGRLLSRSAAFGASVMQDTEDAVGEQMVVEATLAAHLVAVAEAAGVGPAELNARLRQIVADTVLDEIWITDAAGRAYLRNIESIEFIFSPDPQAQPQAHEFWPLLTGEAHSVVQAARQREVDTQVFKYAGVAGVDGPRIVQVGYHAALLERLQQRIGLARLVEELLEAGGVAAIHIFDANAVTLARAQRLELGELQAPTGLERTRVQELLETGKASSFLEGEWLKVVAPIGDDFDGLAAGAILVSLPVERLQAALRQQARLAAVVSVLVLLAGSAVGLLGARSITRPLAELTALTGRIAHGDLSHSVRVDARNELGVLASAFNEMSRRLLETIEDLRVTTAAKERIESELAIARQIQLSMVPSVFPAFPGRSDFEIHAALEPALEVGGDLYDFFLLDDDHLCFAVGDVSGKGVPAALFMAVTKTLFRAAAVAGRPHEILARMNAGICRDNDACMFVTYFCGILDLRNGRLEFANAGHNAPYHLGHGGALPLTSGSGRALGLSETSEYVSGSLELSRGEGLLLYTDGVTEAMDKDGGFYPGERFEALLGRNRHVPAMQLVRALMADLERFGRGAMQSDDVTVLSIRFRPAVAGR